MLFGEHLSADEIAVKCPCGVTATVPIEPHGWFCRRCGSRVREQLRQEAKLARAVVRKARL